VLSLYYFYTEDFITGTAIGEGNVNPSIAQKVNPSIAQKVNPSIAQKVNPSIAHDFTSDVHIMVFGCLILESILSLGNLSKKLYILFD